MVIETSNFQIFKQVYVGLLNDCYIVGMEEFMIEAHDTQPQQWSAFKDILPESISEFRNLLEAFSNNHVSVLSLVLITPSGIKKQDFKVRDLLMEEVDPADFPLKNMPENIIQF